MSSPATLEQQDFSAWSSLLFLPAVGVLIYKGHIHTFWPEALQLITSCYFSIIYHFCAHNEREFCPNKISPELSVAYDIQYAFQAINASVTPVLYAWALHDAMYLRAIYGITMSILSTVLVSLFQDGLESTLTLSLIHAVAIALSLYYHLKNSDPPGTVRAPGGKVVPSSIPYNYWSANMRIFLMVVLFAMAGGVYAVVIWGSDAQGLSWKEHMGVGMAVGIACIIIFMIVTLDKKTGWWRLGLILSLTFGALAVVMRILGVSQFKKDAEVQTELWAQSHGLWHMFLGLAALFFFSILPSSGLKRGFVTKKQLESLVAKASIGKDKIDMDRFVDNLSLEDVETSTELKQALLTQAK